MSQALDVFECPLDRLSLIEASAGTGKTWAICGLVLRLLVERELSIAQVLVVTFTNAATAELRERVRARLVQVLAALETGDTGGDPFIPRFLEALSSRGFDRDTVRLRLAAALAAFDEASIFTIHGFCQRALGESPFAAAQPFALELGDGSDLIRQVVTDYWRQHLAHGHLPELLVAWLVQQGLSPAQLEKLLQRTLKKPLAQPLWPPGLEHLSAPDLSALKRAWQAARNCWLQHRDELIVLLQAKAEDLKNFALDEAVRQWDACFGAEQLLADPGEKAAHLRQSVLTDKKTRAKKTPPSHLFFELADELYQARETLEALLEAHRLALFRHFLDWAPGQVAARKRAQRRVDFDDLLGNLHRALSGPRGETLAAGLRERYPAALIDEFQDTDPLQFNIFQRIYNQEAQGVFLVGDPKQAIYSFRQADLHTYLAARDHAQASYHLDANQRSTEGVIAGINALFQGNSRAFMLEGLDFQATRRGEKPLALLEDESGLARQAFHFWQLPEGDEVLDKGSAQVRSARAVAEEMARLLGAARKGLVRIGGKPLTPGRMAVLVRTHKQGRLIKEALALVGLKAAELAQDSVFRSTEAEDLERLLMALLEPARLGLLKGALATPLLGLDATAIAALALGDTPDAPLNLWLERFARWHRRWLERGILAALGDMDRELQLAVRLLGLPEGERRLTNHLHLLELLHQAEREANQPARLLRWFAAQRREPRTDEVAQLRLESDQDLVSIVTIHKAKGLEYDLVFCPFLWEGGIRPMSDSLPGCSYHDQSGLVLDYRPEGVEAGKAEGRLEHAAELLRLYYVALTRPVQRCYLIWGGYAKGSSKEGPSLTESRRSLLNWLVAGEGITPEDWLGMESRKLPEMAALQSHWQGLAERIQASSEVLPEFGSHGLETPEESPVFQAAEARRRLRPDWRIDSFSGLLRGASPLDDGQDHDLLVGHGSPVASAPAEGLPGTDILHFPKGARAGDCIHHLFEHGDFTRPEQYRAMVAQALLQHPQGESAQAPTLMAMLEQMMTQVLATPLALPGSSQALHLSDLPWSRRLVEMEFHLPAGLLDPERLQHIMAQHGEALPRLAFPALQGFLKGFMDLVFVHEGRYYVLDWKSNHLGWCPEDYGPEAMGRAMLEHGYTLQARLYLLALHRYLAFRLPDYDPARHLGGACYLFVRGVRPDWVLADGSQAGVCLLPPRPELIQAMEAMLAPGVFSWQPA